MNRRSRASWIEQMLVDRREFGTAELAAFCAVGEWATAGNLSQE